MTDARPSPSRLRFEEIHVNDVFSFEVSLSREDVLAFAKLSGDFNPQHVDEAYAKKSAFGKNIVHGLLTGGLFSKLVCMHCPGEKCLYLSQTLQFKSPVLPGDRLLVRGTVVAKNESIRVLTLRTEILNNDKTAVDGEAKVKVLE